MRSFDEWNEEHGDDALQAAYAKEEIDAMYEELVESGDLDGILEQAQEETLQCQKKQMT